MTLEIKFNKLKENLNNMDRVIIAFSGGVDSTFLLKAASVSGLDKILAVTGLSESLPEEEASFAGEIASSLKVTHRTIVTEELSNSNYTDNPPDRCYYCKKELFSRLREIAEQEDFTYILDGTNADDAGDWRPGSRAAREEGVKSPLLDTGLGKDEIRKLSRSLGLPTWNKPATPCLSSRFPYGQKITSEALDRVHKAESFIRSFGVKELRVRNYTESARIEVLPEEFPILMDNQTRLKIIDYLKSLGYRYITIDLQGFRSGSSNEVLEIKGSRVQGAEGSSEQNKKTKD
ncbi:MAG: ATP-dependent sacrificial sulfur transferase LarE [Nitrospirota bacterium]